MEEHSCMNHVVQWMIFNPQKIRLPVVLMEVHRDDINNWNSFPRLDVASVP